MNYILILSSHMDLFALKFRSYQILLVWAKPCLYYVPLTMVCAIGLTPSGRDYQEMESNQSPIGRLLGVEHDYIVV